MKKIMVMLVVLVMGMTTISGCSNMTRKEQGMLVGGTVGGVVGGAVTGGSGWGVGAGALGGALVGRAVAN